MTHRATTERDVATGQRDPANHPITDSRTILSASPCYWQPQTERFIADGEKVVALTVHLVLFPRKANVKEQDRITDIRDRRGYDLNARKLRIVEVLHLKSHIEATVEEYD